MTSLSLPKKPRLRWPIGLYHVAGHSMLPGYRPGAITLGLRWFRPAPGQVVVAHVRGGLVLKRIASLDANGVHLVGDNLSDSHDSRHFGAVQIAALEAKILATIKR